LKSPFIDRVRIDARGGDGGNGCLSFRREKYVPRGGPDGGNGGSGGDVILEASRQVPTLIDFYYRPILKAPRGRHGRGKKQTGRGGDPLVVKVPCGTLVRAEADGKILHDLVEEGERFTLVRGGKGGRGNAAFTSSTRQAPRIVEEGQPGEEGIFFLELRLIADAGLVGYPNAGKSTLLSRLSRARPKIASYPFTTLSPVLGILENDEGERLTIADIPGLIEGAHANVGLGHDFLRHVTRTRFLIFVLDMAGEEGRDPLDDFRSLRRELKLYDPTLAQRPYLVAANKMDRPSAPESLVGFLAGLGRTPPGGVWPISAREGMGLEELAQAVLALAAAVGEGERGKNKDDAQEQ